MIEFSNPYDGIRPFIVLSAQRAERNNDQEGKAFKIAPLQPFDYPTKYQPHIAYTQKFDKEVLQELRKHTELVLIPYIGEETPWHILDQCEWNQLKCGVLYEKHGEENQHHILQRLEVMDFFEAAADEIEDMTIEALSFMRNAITRERIVTAVAKITGMPKLALRKEVNSRLNAREKALKNVKDLGDSRLFLPDHVDRNEFLACGFYEEEAPGKAGYYFAKSHDEVEPFSNFILTPVAHIYDQDDNRRLVEINNGFKRKIIEMPSKTLISLEQFQAVAFEQGNFHFWGTKAHLQRINLKLGDQFPICYEMHQLGWQKQGFFAFSNCVYHDRQLNTMDEHGIVEVGDKKWYSPSSSEAFSEYQEDHFENDRFLTYVESDIEFTEWAELMQEVYGDHKAIMATAFAAISIFRDVVFKTDNSCPMLYAYGQVQSGKSKYGESVAALFFNNMPAFNLNQGTDFAFWNRLGRYYNCPMLFNEFDEDAIKEEWFRGLKSVYDGEGRERGRGGKRNKTETQKINCTVLLMGQILSTKDDGSVLSRCIILPFEGTNSRSDKAVKAFNQLKRLEKKGLTGILPALLNLRETFQESYAQKFDTNLKKLKELIKTEGRTFKERIARNYCSAFTSYQILREEFRGLPWKEDFVLQLCKGEISRLSEMIAETNALADFWNTISFLFDVGTLEDGPHFKIEQALSITLDIGRDKQETKNLGTGGKKLLFMRLNIIHQMYTQECARQRKRALNVSTIRNYMESHEAYIGASYHTRFASIPSTSAVIFDYEKLKLNLERFEDTGVPTELEGQLVENAELIEKPYGIVLEFKVLQDLSYTQENGLQVKKHIVTKCLIRNPEKVELFTKGSTIKVTGNLIESMFKGFPLRNMDVTTYEIINPLEDGQSLPF